MGLTAGVNAAQRDKSLSQMEIRSQFLEHLTNKLLAELLHLQCMGGSQFISHVSCYSNYGLAGLSTEEDTEILT